MDEWPNGRRGVDMGGERSANDGIGHCRNYESIKKEVVR